MEKLTDVKNCHVCGGIDLIPRVNVPIPDIFTDEDVYRTVLQCNDCETMHYIDNGAISYEFSCTLNEPIYKKKEKKLNE